MADTGLQLRSMITDDNVLELSLVETPIPEPGPDEVLVQIEATPLNPSDLALLFGRRISPLQGCPAPPRGLW